MLSRVANSTRLVELHDTRLRSVAKRTVWHDDMYGREPPLITWMRCGPSTHTVLVEVLYMYRLSVYFAGVLDILQVPM